MITNRQSLMWALETQLHRTRFLKGLELCGAKTGDRHYEMLIFDQNMLALIELELGFFRRT
jgi:hypothetical protein